MPLVSGSQRTGSALGSYRQRGVATCRDERSSHAPHTPSCAAITKSSRSASVPAGFSPAAQREQLLAQLREIDLLAQGQQWQQQNIIGARHQSTAKYNPAHIFSILAASIMARARVIVALLDLANLLMAENHTSLMLQLGVAPIIMQAFVPVSLL